MQKIADHGPRPFPEFMAHALYHPQFGFYARHSGQVGRRGDFFTSVSAGPLFGQLLAAHFLQCWREGGGPARWRILEAGAHDGTLAGDILDHLHHAGPEACDGLEYAIVEPLDRLAEAQRSHLARHAGCLHIVRSPAELDRLPGIFVANELLDALPFHVIESDGSGWRELGVAADGSGAFRWHELGPAGPVAANLPIREKGYRTEVRPDFGDFIEPFARALAPARLLWIDYGFEREDLYHPARSEGSMRTFQGHRAGDDPLKDPGSQDITAHVDFTALREALVGLGGRIIRFEDQARFLTGLARPWLLSLEGRTDAATAKQLRNFQTLTHPGQLGRSFHVMEAVIGG